MYNLIILYFIVLYVCPKRLLSSGRFWNSKIRDFRNTDLVQTVWIHKNNLDNKALITQDFAVLPKIWLKNQVTWIAKPYPVVNIPVDMLLCRIR
jgi:hypothetical protein